MKEESNLSEVFQIAKTQTARLKPYKNHRYDGEYCQNLGMLACLESIFYTSLSLKECKLCHNLS